jgi:hypothetical protein
VCQTFLGTNGDDGMFFRVEFDIIAAPVPVTDRLAQARDAARQRIAVSIAALRGLDQLIDDRLMRANSSITLVTGYFLVYEGITAIS